jgi:hypothetical protein
MDRHEPSPASGKPLSEPSPSRRPPPTPIVTAIEEPAAPEQTDVRVWAEQGVPTSLGGLLYLINVMEHLDLPACFEADCALESAVGSVGTLEALARALLGPLSPELEADALWTLLAQLDGRPLGQPPSAQGLQTDALRLPAAWLTAGGDGQVPLFWANVDRRLRIWSGQQYPVLDVSATGDGARQALVEAARFGPAARALLIPGRGEDQPGTDLAWLAERGWPPALLRWLGFVTPFLRWRLARALGVSQAAEIDLVAELARLPAKIYATDCHIDLVAGLDAIRMPLRLAGLDRSPGWVPGLARVVLFHFE